MNKNVILIGRPGSDKTTIGEILSKRLGLKFVNIDQHTIDSSRNSESDLLSGKNNHLELPVSKSIEELVKSKSSVISIEVDVIRDHLNIKELRENGIIIFIDKSTEKIIEDHKPINNRIILKDKVCKLHEGFSEEYELCKKYCDLHLINNNNIEEIVYYISSICS